jgi:hypothetical protein
MGEQKADLQLQLLSFRNEKKHDMWWEKLKMKWIKLNKLTKKVWDNLANLHKANSTTQKYCDNTRAAQFQGVVIFQWTVIETETETI